MQYIEPTFPRPDFIPQIRRRKTIRIRRIAGSAMITAIEGQKCRCRPGQVGCHPDLSLTDGEMNQCSARETQQWFNLPPLRMRISVEAVLIDCIFNTLRKVRFQLYGGDGHAIDE